MNRFSFIKVAAALGVASAFAAPASAQMALTTLGIQAPSAGATVGKDVLVKGTMQYTNSTGSADNFAVGTSTSISASASASSTQDYSVNSTANFALGGTSTINQVIGTSAANSASSSMSIEQAATASASSSVEQNFKQSHNGQSGWWWWGNNQWNSTNETEYKTKRDSSFNSEYERAFANESSKLSGTISGTFTKDAGNLSTTTSQDGKTTTIQQVTPESNDVVVRGIGANNTIQAASTANFTSDITKAETAAAGAGTASGSASGAVNTTASASANSSNFVSSFVQAY